MKHPSSLLAVATSSSRRNEAQAKFLRSLRRGLRTARYPFHASKDFSEKNWSVTFRLERVVINYNNFIERVSNIEGFETDIRYLILWDIP